MPSKILFSNDWQNKQPTFANNFNKPPTPLRGLPHRNLISLVFAMTCFGLIMVYSASAPEALSSFHDHFYFFKRQALAFIIGLLCMITLSRYDYRKLKKFSWPLAIVSFGLLVLTLVPGLSVVTMGSSRWLSLGPIQFQPSEMCKVSSIILLAAGLSTNFWWHFQVVIRIILSFVMALIIVKQPDLGTAMMIIGSMLSLLFVSGFNILLISSGFIVGAGLAWRHIQKTPYQMARIQSWLNPYLSPHKEGWNTIQAQLAIGSGGLFGLGFGRSLQKLYYLPVQHADFIFAVIAEEFGLLGSFLLITCYGLFAYYGFKISLGAKTLFGRFLAIGITSSITLQAIVNIMVTTGIIPVTGITLPLISYGGTSLVITLTMIGLLLSVSRDSCPVEDEEDVVDPVTKDHSLNEVV